MIERWVKPVVLSLAILFVATNTFVAYGFWPGVRVVVAVMAAMVLADHWFGGADQ